MLPEKVAKNSLKLLQSCSIESLLEISSPFILQRFYLLCKLTWTDIPLLETIQSIRLDHIVTYYTILDEETLLCACQFQTIYVILLKSGVEWLYHDLKIDLNDNKWFEDLESAKRFYLASIQSKQDLVDDDGYWNKYNDLLDKKENIDNETMLGKKRRLPLTAEGKQKKFAIDPSVKLDSDSDQDYWNNYA
jgi:hypothetical protein